MNCLCKLLTYSLFFCTCCFFIFFSSLILLISSEILPALSHSFLLERTPGPTNDLSRYPTFIFRICMTRLLLPRISHFYVVSSLYLSLLNLHFRRPSKLDIIYIYIYIYIYRLYIYSIYIYMYIYRLYILLVRLFSIPAVIPFFQEPFWGVSDFPVSYHGYYTFLCFLCGFLIAGVRKNTGRHFKGFYLSEY